MVLHVWPSREIAVLPCVRPVYWLNDRRIYPERIRIPSDRQVKYHDDRAKAGGKMPDNLWAFSRSCGTFRWILRGFLKRGRY